MFTNELCGSLSMKYFNLSPKLSEILNENNKTKYLRFCTMTIIDLFKTKNLYRLLCIDRFMNGTVNNQTTIKPNKVVLFQNFL